MSNDSVSIAIGNLSHTIPPLFQLLIPRNTNPNTGQTDSGRTVTWMNSVQVNIARSFSLVGGAIGSLVGCIIGAAVSLGKALENCICKQVNSFDHNYRQNSPWNFNNIRRESAVIGGIVCALPGVIVGSIVSSVIVPPVSAIANLISNSSLKNPACNPNEFACDPGDITFDPNSFSCASQDIAYNPKNDTPSLQISYEFSQTVDKIAAPNSAPSVDYS